ncbi:MAG: glycine rich protein [Caudoviricetes sp.]|nr:MAG: glycine rich protein [Caudoviricetes sp.]
MGVNVSYIKNVLADSIVGFSGVYELPENFKDIKLTDVNSITNENFGMVISMSDYYLAVGIPTYSLDKDGNNSLTDSGIVFIFKRNVDTWELFTSIVSPTRIANENFGYSVSLTDENLVIGTNGTGKAYIYNIEISSVVLIKTLTEDSSTKTYGNSVFCSDSNIFISDVNSSIDENGNTIPTNSGSVFIYNKNKNWDKTQQLSIPNGDISANDELGYSIDIYNNNTIAISSINRSYDSNNMNYLINSGSVYILSINSDGFSLLQELNSPNRSANANFGKKVLFANNGLYISDTSNIYFYSQINGTYSYTSTIYTAATNLLISDYDINAFLCISLYSTNSNTAPYIDILSIDNITNKSTSIIQYYTDISLNSSNVVSTMNNLFLIGNKLYSSNTGTVNLLTLNSSIDASTNNVTYSIDNNQINGMASDRNANDQLGYKVSYSSYSNTIIASAPSNSYDLNIQNYLIDSGSIYVWKINNDGTLSFIQKIVSQNRTANANFGKNFSTNGNLLIIPDVATTTKANTDNLNVYKFNNGRWILDNVLENQSYNGSISTDGTNIAWTAQVNSTTSSVAIINYTKSISDISTIDISFLTDSSLAHEIEISGNLLMVYDKTYNNNTGVAYAYKNINNVWTKYATLQGWGQARNSNDYFSGNIEIKNNYLYVSATGYSYDINEQNYISNSGLVYIYTLNSDGTYSLFQKLQSNYRQENTNNSFSFGSSIAVSDTNTLYVANKQSSNYGGWIEEFILINGSYQFNQYIGTPNTTNTTTTPGSNVWWYEDMLFISYLGVSVTSYTQDNTGLWKQDHIFTRNDITQNSYSSNDSFGSTVKYKNGLLLISAYTDNYDENGNNSISSAGSVYIYNNTPLNSKNVWNPIQKVAGQVFVDGKQAGDYFGQVVSYYNGNIIVSSPYDSYDENGENYMYSAGAVYVFSVDSDGTIDQLQKIVSNNRVANGQFGNYIKVVGNKFYAMDKNNSLIEFIYSSSGYVYNNTISIGNVNLPDNVNNYNHRIQITENYIVYAISWNTTVLYNNGTTWTNIGNLNDNGGSPVILGDYIISHMSNGNINVYKLNTNTLTFLYTVTGINSSTKNITNVYSKNNKLFLSDSVTNSIYVFDIISEDNYVFSQVLSMSDINNSLNTYDSTSSGYGNTVAMSDDGTLAVGFNNASYYINSDLSKTLYSKAGAAVIYKLSQDPLTSNVQQYQTFTSDSYFTMPSNATGKVRIHVFGDIGTDTTNINKNNYICVEEDAKPGDIYRMFIGNSGVNSISDFNGFKNTNNKISGAATILRKNDDTKNLIIVGGSTTSSSPLDSYLNSTVPTDSTYVATGGNGYGIGVSGDNGSNGSNYIDSEFTVLDNFYYTGSSNLLSSLKTQFATGNYGSVVIEYCVGESNSNMYVYSQDITPQNTNDYNSSDQFGTAIDISNNLLVITSMNHDYDMNGNNTQSLQNSGAAWIYSNTSGKWEQEQKIVPTGTNARNSNDYFGANCKIFNGMAIVSSVNHSYDTNGLNQQNLTNVGAAWVWSKNTTTNTWTQIDKLCPFSKEDATDYCFSIDKNNNTMIIGSPTSQMSFNSLSNGVINDGSYISNSGCVYILNIDDSNNLSYIQKLFSPSPYINGNFGWKVKFYNNKIYVSEPGYTTVDSNGKNTTGSIYEYTMDSTTNLYTLSNTITTNDKNIYTLGYDFDISNNILVSGAPNSFFTIDTGIEDGKNTTLYASYVSLFSNYTISNIPEISSYNPWYCNTSFLITFNIEKTFNKLTPIIKQYDVNNTLQDNIYIDLTGSTIKFVIYSNNSTYTVDTKWDIDDMSITISYTPNNSTFTVHSSLSTHTDVTQIINNDYDSGNYIWQTLFVNNDQYDTIEYTYFYSGGTAVRSNYGESYNKVNNPSVDITVVSYFDFYKTSMGFYKIVTRGSQCGKSIVYDLENKNILSILSPSDYSNNINGTLYGYSVSIDNKSSNDIVIGYPSDNIISGSGESNDIQQSIGSAYVYSYDTVTKTYKFNKRIGAYGNDQYYPVSINDSSTTVSETATLYYDGYIQFDNNDSFIEYTAPTFGTSQGYGIGMKIFIPSDASNKTRIFTQGTTYIDIDCTTTTPVGILTYTDTTGTVRTIKLNITLNTWSDVFYYYWSQTSSTNFRINKSSSDDSNYISGSSTPTFKQNEIFYIGPKSIYDTYDKIIVGGIGEYTTVPGAQSSYYSIGTNGIAYYDDYFAGNINKNVNYVSTSQPSNIQYISDSQLDRYTSSNFTQIVDSTSEIVSPIDEVTRYEPIMYFPYTSDVYDHSGNNLPSTTLPSGFAFITGANDFPKYPNQSFLRGSGSYSQYSIPFNNYLKFDGSFSFSGWFAQWGGNTNNITCDTFSIDITGGSASDEGMYGLNLHIGGQALTISNIPGKNNGGSGPFITVSYDSTTKNVILYCNGLSTSVTLTSSPTINASDITFNSIEVFSNLRIFCKTALTTTDMDNLFSDINYNYPSTTFTESGVTTYYNGIKFKDNTGYIKYKAPCIGNYISGSNFGLYMCILLPSGGSNTTRLFSQPEISTYIDVTMTSTTATFTYMYQTHTKSVSVSSSYFNKFINIYFGQRTSSSTSSSFIFGAHDLSGNNIAINIVVESGFTGSSSLIGMYDTYIGNNSAYSTYDNIVFGGFQIFSFYNYGGAFDGVVKTLSLRNSGYITTEVIDYTRDDYNTIYYGYPEYIESKDTSVSNSLLLTQIQSISSSAVMSIPTSSQGTAITKTIDKNYNVIQQDDKNIILSYITDEYDSYGYNRITGSGAIHIWTYDSTDSSYKFIQRLTSPNRKLNGNFGENILLDNGKLIVTAPGENLGLIYIYESTGTSPYIWQLTDTIDVSSYSTKLGTVINSDITNNQLVIGDETYIDSTNEIYGRVIICDKSSGTWKFTQITNNKYKNKITDAFGYDVKINGNYLAIKSNNILNDSGDDTSAINSLMIYTKTNDIWTFSKKIMNTSSSEVHYNYTQEQESNISLSIPNYLASGTGISLTVYISASCVYKYVLFSLEGANKSPQVVLNQNYIGNLNIGSIQYAQWISNGWHGTPDMNNVIQFNDWNTINVYNNSGTLEFYVNGNVVTNTSVQSGVSNLILNCNPHVILGGISYIKGNYSITAPYQLNSNILSILDFSDMSLITVNGDTTQLSIITNSLNDNKNTISIPQKVISVSGTTNILPYTNGYTGSYEINIPNYLAPGTGISIVSYMTPDLKKLFALTSTTNTANYATPSITLNELDGGSYYYGNVSYYDFNGSYWNTSGTQLSVLKGNMWSTISIFNDNGKYILNVNGNTSSFTAIQSISSLILSIDQNLVVASIAYTKSDSVSYPFNNDNNVVSYIDFADPNNPKIYGDTTQLQVTSKSLTSTTPLANLPSVEITSGTKTINSSIIDRKYSQIWLNETYITHNITCLKIADYNITNEYSFGNGITKTDTPVSSYNNSCMYVTKDSNNTNSLQSNLVLSNDSLVENNIIYNGVSTLQNTIPTQLTYSNYILEDQIDTLLYSNFYRYHIWGTNVNGTPSTNFYQNIGKYVKIDNGKIFTYCESDTYDEQGTITGSLSNTNYAAAFNGNIGSVINLYKGADGNYRYSKKIFGNLPTSSTGYNNYNYIAWLYGNIEILDSSYYINLFHATTATNNSSLGILTNPTTYRQDSSYTYTDTGIIYSNIQPWGYSYIYKNLNIGNYIVEKNNVYFSNWLNSFGNGILNSTYDSTNTKWNTITTLTCNLYNGGKTSNMMYGANMGVVGNNLLITAYKANGSSIGKTIYSTGTGTAYVYNSKFNITRFLGNNDFTGVNYSGWQLTNMYAFLSINENGILFRNAYYGYNSTVSSYVNLMQYSYDSDTDTISSVGVLVPPSDGGISTANFTQTIATLTTKTSICDCIRILSGYMTGSNNNSSILYTITYPILINGTVYKYNVFYGNGSYSIINGYIISAYDDKFVIIVYSDEYSYYVTYKIQDIGYSIYNVRPTFNTSSMSIKLPYNSSSMFGIGIDSKIINVYGINDTNGSIILKSLVKSNMSYVTSLYADDDNIICGNTSYYTSANIGNTLGNTGSFFYSKYNSDYNQYVSVPYKNGSIGYSSVYLSGNGGGYYGGSIQVDNTQLSGGNGGLSFAPDDWTILESEYTSTAPSNSDTDKNTAGNGGLSNNGADGLVVITDNNGNKTLYGFTNSDQTYIVPAGVTSITVKIWGAGGGASTATKYYGGAGAYTTGTISVSPSDVYTIIVGKGGLSGNNLISTPTSDEYSYGYGSYGAIVSKSVATGSGGGLSSIIYSGKIIAVAAGGGGAGLGSNGGAGCKNTQTYIFGGQGAPLSIPEKPYANSRNTNDWFGWDIYIIDNKNILISSPQNTGDLYGNTLTNQSGCIWKYTLTKQSNNKVAWDISDKIIAPNNTYMFGSSIYNKNNNYIIGSSMLNNMCYITTYNDNFENQDSSVIDLSKSFVLNNSTYYAKIVYVATNGNYIISAWGANRFVSESDDGLTNTGAIGVYSNSDLSTIQLLQEDGPINGTANNDYFGTGHLIYNNYILIGNNPSSAASRRKIQVFKDNGTSINYVKDLIEPISVTSSYYGTSIKLANDIISVCDYKGYLYNYGMVNNDLVLTKSTKLDTSYNTTYNDIVSISSNNYIFGNPSDPRGSYTNQPNITGAGTINIVYNNITRFYSIDGISNGLAQTNDYFGTSVKFLNNNLFVIGSPGHGYDYNGNPVTNTGAIYSYILNGNSIINDTIISNPYQNTTYAGFGSKIKRSSDTSFVTGTTTNIVNILNRIGDKNWQTVNSLNVPVNGVSDICFNGKTLLIGNISNSYITNTVHSLPYNLQTNQGGIGIFNLTNGVWSIKDSYILNGTPFTGSTGSNFGHIVRYYNNTLVISAPNSTIDNKGNSVTTSSGNIYTYMFDDYYGKGTIKSIRSSSMYKQYGFMLDLSKDGQIVVVGGSKNTYSTADSYTINEVTLPIIPNISSNISDIAISKNIISIGYEQYNDNTGVVQLYTLDDNVWKYNTSLQAFINENVYDKTNPNNFTNSPLPTKGDYTGQSVYMNSNVGLVYSAIGNATDQQGNISKTNAGAIFVVDVSKHITTN